jgi:hypothetical protein
MLIFQMRLGLLFFVELDALVGGQMMSAYSPSSDLKIYLGIAGMCCATAARFVAKFMKKLWPSFAKYSRPAGLLGLESPCPACSLSPSPP